MGCRGICDYFSCYIEKFVLFYSESQEGKCYCLNIFYYGSRRRDRRYQGWCYLKLNYYLIYIVSS